MFTDDKVTEIFCMAADFCKFFDTMMAKYMLKPVNKRQMPVTPQCQRQIHAYRDSLP